MKRWSAMLGCGGVLFLALGCGDGGSGPNPGGDGPRLAAQFERLADSVANAGYSPTAEALRHAAEIVRLAGGATPVTLRIDGATRSFLAVAEQIDFPNLVCSWPADSGIAVPADSVIPMPGTAPSIEPYPGDCTVVDTSSMRTLIAWEPERMAEVVRIVGDIGGGGVQPTVPDVMVALPATAVESTPPAPSDPPDSAVSGGGNDGSGGGSGGGGGGYPGFMGEYLVRDVGSWWAVEGEQSNALAELSGACTASRATIDWAEFTCSAARFRFGFSMRVEALRYEPLMQTEPGGEPAWDGAQGSHVIELEQTSMGGVRLTVVGWTPPPVPPPLPPGPPPLPPGPPPIDSSTVSP